MDKTANDFLPEKVLAGELTCEDDDDLCDIDTTTTTTYDEPQMMSIEGQAPLIIPAAKRERVTPLKTRRRREEIRKTEGPRARPMTLDDKMILLGQCLREMEDPTGPREADFKVQMLKDLITFLYSIF